MTKWSGKSGRNSLKGQHLPQLMTRVSSEGWRASPFHSLPPGEQLRGDALPRQRGLVRTALQSKTSRARRANPGHRSLTTDPGGGGLGLLPSGLRHFPGLGMVPRGLRQQELLGSISRPGTTFTGRSGKAFASGGAGGVVPLPLQGGQGARRPGACGCFCPSRRLAPQRAATSLQRHLVPPRGLAGQVGGAALLSWAVGWGCVLEPRVCKGTRATGARGGWGQGSRLCGRGGAPTPFLPFPPFPPFPPFALNRKRDTWFYFPGLLHAHQRFPPTPCPCATPYVQLLSTTPPHTCKICPFFLWKEIGTQSEQDSKVIRAEGQAGAGTVSLSVLLSPS